jgi:hypothetical protein
VAVFAVHRTQDPTLPADPQAANEHLAPADTIDDALRRYEQALRPVVTDKQRAARDGVRWFLPATTGQLRIHRAVLKLARLPVVDRHVTAALAGKPTAVVTRLHAGRLQTYEGEPR